MRPVTGRNGALILALLALVTNAAHHNTRLENFGPELKHRKYDAPSIVEQEAIYSSSLLNNPKEIALEFVREQLTDSEFKVKNSYKSETNGVTHVYLRQIVNDLEVVNGDINVNVDESGRVISYGDSFYKGDKPQKDAVINSETTTSKFQLKIDFTKFGFNKKSRKSKREYYSSLFNNPDRSVISPEEAIFSLAKHINQDIPHPEKIDYTESVSFDGDPILLVTGVPFAISDVEVTQVYVQTDEGKLQLCWDLKTEMENNWYHGQVNAHDGKVVQLIDWVADASYNVFPIGINDPSDGSRETVIDPADKLASPLGWHSQSRKKNFTVTIGNNVFAHENLAGSWEWENNYRPEGGQDLNFDFPLSLEKTPKTYIDSSITNLFYWNNIVHDLFYRYGFNEVAGNFQQSNFGKGGKSNDAVIANAQDGSGYNNANFATPPDGQHGKMRMYVWDVVNPWRDGDLEAGIVIHEYSHGISTRLTGGPANSGCLGWGEAGGMGEGWGDYFATILRMKPSFKRDTTEFGMGAWANGGEGIRRYKYSTSKKTNPETFSWMDKPGYWGVHPKGAVWAEMLYEVYWNLVDKHGFTSDWFPPTNEAENSSWYTKPRRRPNQGRSLIPKHGNTLALQLVVDAMKLQPCRPQFIDARNAIIQADEVLTGGENKCEIWRGFAKRGLGTKAKIVGGSPWGGGVRKESDSVPKECEE